MYKTNISRLKPLAGAMFIVMGSAALSSMAEAEVYSFTFGSGQSNYVDFTSPRVNDGLFTMLDPNGIELMNVSKPYYYDTTWDYGRRTQVSGTLTFDTDTMSGTGTILPFSFFKFPTIIHNITLSNAGLDPDTGSQLVLGKIQYDWRGSIILPLEIIWDVSGLLDALASGVNDGDVIAGGAIPTSNNIRKGGYPIGPAPVATTSWNVSANGDLPLIDDGIGGSPLRGGSFSGFNANFDITRLVVGDGIGVKFLNITIQSEEGETPECTSRDGGVVHYSIAVTGGDDDPVTDVEWQVDGVTVAAGLTAQFNVPLGSHNIFAAASTAGGRSATNSETVRVLDTVGPVINARFIHARTGETVTEVISGNPVDIKMEAIDACDPVTEISAMGGFHVESDDRFTAIKRYNGSSSEVTVTTQTDDLNFTVIAKDSSGNTSTKGLTLNVKDRNPVN